MTNYDRQMSKLIPVRKKIDSEVKWKTQIALYWLRNCEQTLPKAPVLVVSNGIIFLDGQNLYQFYLFIAAFAKAITLCVEWADVSALCVEVDAFIEAELLKAMILKNSKKLERSIRGLLEFREETFLCKVC